MSIQKKSLLSTLNTTKKAIVASTPAKENPSVSAPVSAHIRARVRGKVRANVAARVTAKVRSA
jgi:hypothetical protein